MQTSLHEGEAKEEADFGGGLMEKIEFKMGMAGAEKKNRRRGERLTRWWAKGKKKGGGGFRAPGSSHILGRRSASWDPLQFQSLRLGRLRVVY